MKNIFSSFWFWLFVLATFLTIILWNDDSVKNRTAAIVRQRLKLNNVHFSELDQGFEHVRVFADEALMDDMQNNMTASSVRALFFNREIATMTSELIASWADKTAFEAKFWGDVRFHSSDRKRFRTRAVRYFLSRKELYTSQPVTIWKDDMVITGNGLRYNTQTKKGSIPQNVLIRIWNTASDTKKSPKKKKININSVTQPNLPVAPPPGSLSLGLPVKSASITAETSTNEE